MENLGFIIFSLVIFLFVIIWIIQKTQELHTDEAAHDLLAKYDFNKEQETIKAILVQFKKDYKRETETYDDTIKERGERE